LKDPRSLGVRHGRDRASPSAPAVSAGEKKAYLALSALFLALLALPYVWAYVRTPPGFVFTGALNQHEDQMAFLEMIKQGRDGLFFFEERFTTEPQTRNLFLPLWLILGQISRLTGLPPMFVSHLARLGFAALFLVLLRRFLERSLREGGERLIAAPLILFGGGLGWLVVRLPLPSPSWLPVDRVMPESLIFSSFYLNTHWAAAICLMMFCFLSMIEKRDGAAALRSGLAAGTSGAALAFVHPYDVPVVLAASAAYAVWVFRAERALNIRFWLPYLSLTIGGAVAAYANGRRNAVASAIADSLAMPSGHVMGYVFGYGAIFVLAVVGVWKAAQERNGRLAFPIVWAVVTFALVYSPVFFQRRLIFGVHIALGVLAAHGLFHFLSGRLFTPRRGSRIAAAAAVAAVLLLSFPSNAYVITRDMRKEGHPSYIRKELRGGLAWMDRNLGAQDVVLSTGEAGMFVPPYTRAKVFFGHWCCTLNREAKKAQLERFWSDEASHEDRRLLLRHYGITWVLHAPFLSETDDFHPSVADYLKIEHSVGDVAIYRVRL
jgi:hypothetical protein